MTDILTKPLVAVAVLLLSGPSAWAQDSDQDGVPDAADVYPCDASVAGEAFAPAEAQFGLLEFEDEWPAVSDLDFNDAVIAYNYAVKTDANGDAVSVRATFHVLALGGVFDHGFGLQLPVPAGAVASVTRTLGTGSPTSVTPRPADASLTVDVVADLRTLYGGQADQINSIASQPTLTSAPVQLDVTFTQPVAVSMALAPFDVFIFRLNAPGHEIHRTPYAGTAAMDATLFGSGQDASAPGRNFVDGQGLPYALDLPQVAPYPAEAVAVSQLFPDIVAFAASAGASNTDFYTSNVQGAVAFGAAATPSFANAPPAPDRSCVPVFAANGGTTFETQGGRYTVHTFTADGSLDITGPSREVEVLMVGGGGSGGGRHGGGGGGGGVLMGTITLGPQSYPIVIGAGGAAVTGTNVAGNDGQPTTAFGAVALGGGGGGTYNGIHGRAGGSGGGGGHSATNGGASTQADSAGLTGHGHPGAANAAGVNEASGGGGAGASDAAIGVNSSSGGRGGSGIFSSIDGNGYYYAGGGGGGGWQNNGGPGGIGGGGGGNTAAGGTPGAGGGSARNPGEAGQGSTVGGTYFGGAGGANTGGGGGGSGQAEYGGYTSYGGAGGSGIVIVRYLTPGYPSISLAAAAPSVPTGGSTTINWSTTDASSCSASGDWSGTKAGAGSESTGALSTSKTYTLSCTGARGTSSKTIHVAAGGALGGLVSDVGAYRVHTFIGDGALDVLDPSLALEVLMVGGGGGGGGRHGGGGGGGGVLTGAMTVSGGSYPVAIGAGGAPVTGTNVPGNDGSPTTAFGAVALGGGGGGTYNGVHGRAGGSGGGGGHSSTNGGAALQSGSAGLTGHGNPGANNPSGVNEASGGGGAGANNATAGVNSVSGGNGGSGILSTIDGNSFYYAGGGGGGGWQHNGGQGGVGGGGGGNTAAGGTPGTGGGNARNPGQSGVGSVGGISYGADGGANTGGGGGGSGQSEYTGYFNYGGAGGSGIVIVRYPR